MPDVGERDATQQVLDAEWVAFPGGELEGRRPRARCAACREARGEGGSARRLCFECYRADLDRRRAIGEVLSRVINPFEREEGRPAAVVRHFHVPPTPADGDPRYAALARRRREAQLAARRALAEPVIDLERFPESWRPFVRVAMNA